LHTLELLYTVLFTKLLLSIKLLSKILSELFKLKVSFYHFSSLTVLTVFKKKKKKKNFLNNNKNKKKKKKKKPFTYYQDLIKSHCHDIFLFGKSLAYRNNKKKISNSQIQNCLE